MAKQLYEVHIDDHIYVMAESEAEAEAEARLNFSSIYDLQFDAYLTTSCYHDWYDTVPYNSDDQRTCGQICKELMEKEKKEKYLRKHHRELPFDFK